MRHCWQNQFRRVIPDADLHEYVKTLHGDFAVEYRPHDMYVGNYLTMLTLLDSGVPIQYSCSQGICGTCCTPVLEGRPDHRDDYLSAEEKSANRSMMVCCSGSLTPRLVLDL